jgi:hypothetical protein
MKRSLFLGLFLAAVALAAVFGALNAVSPFARIDVPFEAGRKGAVVEAALNVTTTTERRYTFYLDLLYRPKDWQDMGRVRTLAGTGAYRDGRQIDTGLAIPVRLSVDRVDGGGPRSILDGVFTRHDLEGFSADRFFKVITRIRLEPGRYWVRIEALDNIPELDGTPVHLDIHIPGNS